jgi:HAE1 family hydrophobic/amphiphilic exporter-1
LLVALLAAFLAAVPVAAQTFPQPEYFRNIAVRPVPPTQLPGPEGLADYVVEGKLRLGLTDVIRLTLANNTDVRINQLTYEGTRFAIGRAHGTFDPVFTGSFSATRSATPTTDVLQGAPTLSQLNQGTSTSYSQTFQTGTRTAVSFNASKSSTNSQFATFNPSLTANLDVRFTQPLWRNFGLAVNQAPIVIARRNLRQSRANFEAQVSQAIADAVDDYWAVVQARDTLAVQRKSLELAEASYQRDKRSLELGALPPLDIYRSESQVANRRVQVITAEYALKRAEDNLRRTIGADLDPRIRALDLELTEMATPAGELVTIDAAEAIERALANRPELEALRLQLANDDTSINLAHNSVKPDLNLTGFYASNGRGGNQLDPTVVPPAVIAPGGFGNALDQVFAWDFPTYGFSVQLRLPIRNRAAESDLGTALVNKRRDLYSLRQREQAITLEARNAVHQLEQAKLTIGAARIARDLAQKNLEAEQRKYELGAQTIFFVLDAQTQLATAEQALLQAEIGYQRAVTSVERTIHTLLGRYQVQITEYNGK